MEHLQIVFTTGVREDGSEVVELPTSCSAPPVAAGGAAGASVGPARTSEGKLTESLYFVPKTLSGAVPEIPTATSINTDEPEPQGNHDVLPQTAGSPSPSATSTSSTHTPNCWSRISNRKLKVVTIVFATLLLSAFGIALCANYVWIPLHNLTQSHDVLHREGNVPILLQLSSLLVKKFRVVQEVDLKDSLHTVSVYLPNYGCNELRTTTTTQHYNASAPPPDIPIYMLEHSHISLHTCATTKEDENNPVFFYITKTVEKSINFDGNQKKGRHAISVGIDDSFKYTTISSLITSKRLLLNPF
ncbi:hypothetical protein GBAR_LOCUS15583 [Geodia barretti]|uniref:Uncharacterized protein n=1 Tax=Geodia barretti TaxID=519541 RepID=A0AA35SDK8_GEOBA|nr:hypothetical protein GBAR_LOCUS15583 [Geodia barretti]